jgi:periplasmic protein TonB
MIEQEHSMTPKHLNPSVATDRRRSPAAWACTCVVLALGACTTTPPPMPEPAPVVVEPAPPPPVVVAPEPPPALISNARSPMEYRKDGAQHLYGLNGHRIFKGKLPPLLHAVGVLQVEVDARGNVRQVNWMRAPSHVPHVMQEIERTVRQAAPFPAPVALGGVTYTDVWLWDHSGQFQLDTLTEGQRSR